MSKATRQAFGESLAELGAKHSEIVVLDADLSKSTKSELFAKKFPERFFEMGIAEANMIGTAAGLAFAGKIPFLCSFGCFLTGRYDTIRLSVAYSGANVRLVGTHAGVGIGDDGHSQMGLEDITLMRALPTMGVFQPMDTFETQKIMESLVTAWQGPAYLRLTRQNLPDLSPKDQKFEFGKLVKVTRPSNPKVLVIGTGAGTAEAYSAAQQLGATVPVEVWNANTLKPFDEKTLHQELSRFQAILTVEDHSVIGGLGSAVAEVLATESHHPRLIRIGVQDQFGESGEPLELFEKHGLTGRQIAQRIAELRLK